jgi:hypothetical protein
MMYLDHIEPLGEVSSKPDTNMLMPVNQGNQHQHVWHACKLHHGYAIDWVRAVLIVPGSGCHLPDMSSLPCPAPAVAAVCASSS